MPSNYVVYRYRGRQRQWYGLTRAEKPHWYKTRASAYEFIGFSSAMIVAQKWANRRNNWKYEVHSTSITTVPPEPYPLEPGGEFNDR